MVGHPLEVEYGLTAAELLEAVSKRFRAKVALEGAVAEVHLGKHIQDLAGRGLLARWEVHDQDGQPDYSVWLARLPERELRIECKNVRDSEEAYRKQGAIVAYKVETQKTRASQGDPASRFYGFDQFDILAVCLGKKTHDWRQFMFILCRNLVGHSHHRGKIAVMHPVPLEGSEVLPPWYHDLGDLLETVD